MSPPKSKKRSSILKKRQSLFESPEATTTTLTTKRKGVLFSEKNAVKEFLQCDEKTTIWGNSYETSIAKSEGSSDGSHSSKKLSLDFTSSTIHTTLNSVVDMECEKENFVMPQQIEEIPVPEADRKSNSLNNSESSSLNNLTVEINHDEKQRLKKYGFDNLNITNMQMDSPATVLSREKLVISPRKSIFLNDSSNITIAIEEDEISMVKKGRKTIHKPDEMDLTLNNSSYSLRSKQGGVFKAPEPPKPIKFVPKFFANDSEVNTDSPPIKPPKLEDQKKIMEELMDFMVTETPTKNLCRQMCTAKKHGITPLQQQPPAKVPYFEFEANETNKRNSSMTILRDLGLGIDSPDPEKVSFGEDVMELETQNVVVQVSKARQTIFDTSVDETVNKFESKKTDESIKPTKDVRKTLFEDEMNVTLGSSSSAPLKPSSQSRKTLFEEDIEETVPVKISNLRKTTFDDEINETQSPKEQKTFFDIEDIEETLAKTKTVTLVKIKDLPKVEEKRLTIAYNDDISFEDFRAPHKACSTMNCTTMDDTGVSESTNELARKASRLLQNPMANTASTSNLFNSELSRMDLTTASVSSSLCIKHSEINSIEISGIEPTEDAPIEIIQKPRATIYDQNSIEEDALESPKESAVKSRQTIYGDKTITETSIDQELVKKASHESSAIDIEHSEKQQITIYQDSIEEEKENLPVSPVAQVKNRKTVHEEIEMNETNQEDFEILIPRRATLVPDVDRDLLLESIRNVSSQEISLELKQSLTIPTPAINRTTSPLPVSPLPPPVGFNSPVFHCTTEYENHEMELTNEHQKDEKAGKISRKTVYEEVVMETEEKSQENHTFTVHRYETFMNITDAEIIAGMNIDDESYPMSRQSLELQSTNVRNSTSSYIGALRMYVNETLNASMSPDVSVTPLRRETCEIEPTIDYNAKWDDFIASLDKKEEEQPRLDIDEFMEKLNIQPVTIPFYPELDPDYCLKRNEESKKKIEKKFEEFAAKKAKIESSQLPQIPDQNFLLSNKIECIKEEAKLAVTEKVTPISPIFPEFRYFDFLLKNKFLTNEHLSKYWNFDFTFATMGQYKFVHKRMKVFELNFSVKSAENINDSSIPIYFEKVVMCMHPEYRGQLGLKTKVLMNEFKRVIGTDNFTSKCPSTAEFFEFIEFFHEQVMKTAPLVDNFFKVVSQNDAIIEQCREFDTTYIIKRHFNQEIWEVVDIKIVLFNYIEDTTINCVSLKGHTCYEYELKPRKNIAEMKGLMLIETILFDVGRFLQDNATSVQVE